MEGLPLAVLDRLIQENESALATSFGDAGLPDTWAQDLAAFPRDTPLQKLAYYARLKHWYWTRYEQRRTTPDTPTPEAAMSAARKLLRREPVITTLAGRRVAITGRSYNALAEIAAHHLRIRELAPTVEQIERLTAQTIARFRPFLLRRRVRRRLQLLRTLHAQLLAELLAHRRALYAHALTADGAPLTDLSAHPAPWWKETTAEDDARLLTALVEVGPARYAQLGVIESKEEGKRSPFNEDFGFHSLLTWVEGKREMEPAALYNQDVGQILAAVRAGALARPDADSLEV